MKKEKLPNTTRAKLLSEITETKKKTHNKSFFKRENSVSEINSEDLYSQNSDNNVTIFVSNDDPSKEFY